jgi:hypothetical protein
MRTPLDQTRREDRRPSVIYRARPAFATGRWQFSRRLLGYGPVENPNADGR